MSAEPSSSPSSGASDGQRLLDLVEGSPAIFWTTSADLSLQSVRGGGLASLKVEAERLHGQHISSLFEENKEPVAAHRRALQGRAASFEKVFSTSVYSARVEPLRSTDGSIVGTTGFAIDITERQRAQKFGTVLFNIAEEAFAADDLKAFFAALHQIIGELLYADNFYVALRDQQSQLITFPYFADKVDPPPPPQPPGSSPTDLVLQSGSPLLLSRAEIERRAQLGQLEVRGTLPIAWLGAPLFDGHRVIGVLAVQSYDQSVRYGEQQQELLVFVSRHISTALSHRRSELALRQSEERYRRLFEEDLTGVVISKLDGTIEQCNPAFAEIFEFESTDQAIGSNMDRLYREKGRRQKTIDRLRRERRIHFDEVEVRSVKGRRLYVSATILGRFDADGNLEWIQSYVFDITNRKALEAQLRQSQRLESLGRLAGGVAHDFNNQLTAILGYCELMLRMLDDNSSLSQHAMEIRRAGQRAAEMTHQLMTFSKRQPVEARPTDLNAVVGDMRNMLEVLIGEDYSLDTDLAGDLDLILADPGQLEQVILNLVVNGRDASPGGGSICLETANATIDQRQSPRLAAGEYVCLRVVDQGIGIDDQTLERLFEPFFSTKKEGTGLGLSTVHGIVQQSGGAILVDSSPNRGSTFELYFPRTAMPVTAVDQQATAAGPGGSETILLVEDEPAVRALSVAVLSDLGYRVLAAASPTAALDLAGEHPIDLLITDVVLPEISGRDLAARLLREQSNLAVLFVSGYTDSAIVDRGIRPEEHSFLSKPFRPDELSSKVRELLDGQVETLANRG